MIYVSVVSDDFLDDRWADNGLRRWWWRWLRGRLSHGLRAGLSRHRPLSSSDDDFLSLISHGRRRGWRRRLTFASSDDNLLVLIPGWWRRRRLATSEEPFLPLSRNGAWAVSAVRRQTTLALSLMYHKLVSLHIAHASGRWRTGVLVTTKDELLICNLRPRGLGPWRRSSVASTSPKDYFWRGTSGWFWLSFGSTFTSANQDVCLLDLSSVSWPWRSRLVALATSVNNLFALDISWVPGGWWSFARRGFASTLSNDEFVSLDPAWRATSAGDVVGIVVRLAVLNYEGTGIGSSIVFMEEIGNFGSAGASAIAYNGFWAVSVASTVDVDLEIFIVAGRTRSRIIVALTVLVDISSRIPPRHDDGGPGSNVGRPLGDTQRSRSEASSDRVRANATRGVDRYQKLEALQE